MRYPAQIQTAIELLNLTEESHKPADRFLAAYFRENRYIGGSDKGAISTLFYAVLRNKGEYAARARQLGMTPNGRTMVLAHLLKNGEEVDDIFSGEKYQPARPTPAEQELIDSWQTVQAAPLPLHAELNMPEWVMPKLQKTFGDDVKEACTALNTQAPLDIRANTLNIKRDYLQKKLAKIKETAETTPHSPWGLRLAKRTPIHTTKLFKDGLFEVQDEGSQILALLTGAKPGDMVVDYCAGAGGKTLALAAMMENKGRLVACDVEDYKLAETKKRIRRAGVSNTQLRLLDAEGNRWCKRQAGKADVVLVDAPCSGSGTWRRAPDGKWRLTQERVNELKEMQINILRKAAKIVKPGGRLVYATCSIFWEENEAQAEAFNAEAEHAGYKQISVESILPEFKGEFLKLAPHSHGTDGFFAAVWERTE